MEITEIRGLVLRDEASTPEEAVQALLSKFPIDKTYTSVMVTFGTEYWNVHLRWERGEA